MPDLRKIELLTPHNYHAWKLKMTKLLQSKGLWKKLVAQQPKFTREFEKFTHRSKMDEAKGLIGLHVYDNFLHKAPKETNLHNCMVNLISLESILK